MWNNMTPLRQAAFNFAIQAGYRHGFDIKLKEHRGASAYDVFVRKAGAKRGKCIGAILLRAVYARDDR
jgi:hypothetical protein